MSTLGINDSQLPNGFHDAVFIKLCLDREMRSLALILDVDVSSVLRGQPEYKRCRLQVSDLLFLVVEPHALDCAKDNTVVIGPLEGDSLKRVHDQALPLEATAGYVFVHETNSTMYFAGKSVALEWPD